MEDMARLAVIEQNIGDGKRYRDFLYAVLRLIYRILENPHEYELRIIKDEGLDEQLKLESVTDYLKYLGFQKTEGQFKYPKQHSLNTLRIAEAVVERKINLCYGPIDRSYMTSKCVLRNDIKCLAKKPHLTPVNILKTHNSLLQRIQSLFNDVLKYEDEGLQEIARKHIPISSLQMLAIDRVREHQKCLKTGEIKGNDLSFDIALLIELLSWFKEKFFTWVDKPLCGRCGSSTSLLSRESANVDNETCTVEIFQCARCMRLEKFPRYNSPRTLLRTRRGRCGEWANCFALLCRSMGYDTRYIYDTTDHVWCEVYDYERNTWLHVDPCENKLNAPLMYCHGWGKKLSYVIAVSRDDLQDVTWRYTMDHKEVLKRRDLCGEMKLIDTMMSLRECRQKQVSEPRRRYLTKRCLQELVQLMVERKPMDYENEGRLSGSKTWRRERGETGTKAEGHTFEFSQSGDYCIRYHTGVDRYHVTSHGVNLHVIPTWEDGVYACNNIFRKHETDWNKVYLARLEGKSTGSISWRLSTASNDVQFTSLSITLSTALYENGNIACSVKFDDEKPILAQIDDTPKQYNRTYRCALITAELSGGVGDVAWQHAQLFRQSSDDSAATFQLNVHVENVRKKSS